MFHRTIGRRAVLALAVPLTLASCSDKVLKEKQDDLPSVQLSLKAETVKPWYGSRLRDPEPVQLKLTLTNETNRVVDVLNRFVPARATDPGLLSPLRVSVVRGNGRAVPLNRYHEPNRPTWEDFKTLGPNESVSGIIDLRESFPDLREPGQYRITTSYFFGEREQAMIRSDSDFQKGWFWQKKAAVWPWSGHIHAAPVTVTLKRVAEPALPKPQPSVRKMDLKDVQEAAKSDEGAKGGQH